MTIIADLEITDKGFILRIGRLILAQYQYRIGLAYIGQEKLVTWKAGI